MRSSAPLEHCRTYLEIMDGVAANIWSGPPKVVVAFPKRLDDDVRERMTR